jgi:hypothetical protein
MASLVQRSFSGGELAPALYARVDTIKYANGLRRMRNSILMRHGGSQNRPGTEFIAEVKDSSKETRIIEFIFNTDQTYVIELGHEYMRFHKDKVQLTDMDLVITSITAANPAVVTYTGTDTGLVNGNEMQIAAVTGALADYVNGRNFKIANVNTGANTFELKLMDGTTNFNSTAIGTGSGGTAKRVYEIETDYQEEELFDIRYVQSADVITLVHPNHPPAELSRTGDINWSLDDITFEPSIAAPGSVTNSGAAGATYSWVVTTVKDETLEESLQSTATTSSSFGTAGTPVVISWGAVSGAREYNVYKLNNGVYGFIGVAGSTSFSDIGLTGDVSDTPPTARNPFASTDNYPSCVAYIQQRLMFANTNNDPEKTWGSRIGQFHNFTTSSPIQDDDAVTYTLAGRQVNSIKNLLDLGRLIQFTQSGEWSIQGDSDGVIKPSAINPKQYSYNGSGELQPLVIGGNALYLQARGSIVRDLGFDYQVDGYSGNDLTVFSNHLFQAYQLVDWCYQQIPHSIVWAVRNDGTLVALTYMREQQIAGWHRHDFGDDLAESVCSTPMGNEDSVYVVVNRTIDGETKRYIECFSTRQIDDIVDVNFTDCSLGYDGRNTGETTMTLSGGTDWTHDETLTLTASAATFSTDYVGNEIHLTGEDGEIIRFRITAYTDTDTVSGKPNRTVPASLRNTAVTAWAYAVDRFTGLWHLNGKTVSVFADGYVVASPYNPSYTTVTVEDGAIELDRCYSVIRVGLPYVSDLETLNIDTPNGETMSDKAMIVSHVTLFVEKSRGVFVGTEAPDTDYVGGSSGLREAKIRSDESYDEPISLQTGTIEVNVPGRWNSNGRVFIRQVDPIPLSVLAAVPAGKYPMRGA